MRLPRFVDRCYYLCSEAATVSVVGVEGAEAGAEVTPTAGQTAQVSRQLVQQGRKSLEKSLQTLERRLAEHEADLQRYKAAGGYTGSVETAIQNFKGLIQALKNALGR